MAIFTSSYRNSVKSLKPKKIIAPQAQVWRFEMHNFNWLIAQTSLGYGTKPIFETNYARYQISEQKIIDFFSNTSIWKCASLNLFGRRTSLYVTKKVTLNTRTQGTAELKNPTIKVCMWW